MNGRREDSNGDGRRREREASAPRRIARFAAIAVALSTSAVFAQEPKPTNVERTTIDVGVVVSDVEKSLAFYVEALGFAKAGAFDLPADLGTDVGLSDGQPAHVHVLTLGAGESATRLKLMQFPRAPGARPDNRFVHSTYGVRYLTIFVKDLDQALAHAQMHGVKPLGKGAIDVPEKIAPGLRLAIVRDPDGNLIELIGTQTKKAVAN